MGPNWKKLTGAEQPVPEKLVYSEDYGQDLPARVGSAMLLYMFSDI